MADPLSIAASVVGLLSAAAKISTVLNNFISSIADVPQSARTALAAVEGMRLTLSSVRQLMDRLSQVPRERKEMIHVRYLVVVFRESILSLSELEAIVCPAGSARAAGKVSVWNNMKWMLEEEKILSAVQRLESHRTSLFSMLTILQCQSQIEAQENLDALQKSVEQMVDRSESLLRRLEQYEIAGSESASVRFFDDGASVFQTQAPTSPSSTSALSGPVHPSFRKEKPVSRRSSLLLTLQTSLAPGMRPAEASEPGSVTSPREFEVTLEKTRVYARVQSNDCDISFTSSAVRTNAWSVLSGLSLNDISVVSVFALPIVSIEELNSIGSHLTFASILSGAREPTPSAWSRRDIIAGKFLTGLIRRTRQPSSVLESSPVQSLPAKLGAPAVVPSISSYKLVVLGDESVGKTQLTTQFCLETFDETYYPTIENSYRKQWLVDGEFCMLKIVDTAGQEQYNALRGEWIRDGEVFIIVYSITSRTTFQRVRLFHIQVSRGIESLLYRGELLLMPIIIVGNMCDRAAEREVMTQEGEALAKELGCDFVEASAKTGTNVDRAFCDAVRRVRWHREQQRQQHGDNTSWL